MRPERLEFCGINSFSEKAVIDFGKLLAGGIFGIFGDTGSGKTTILDSMVLALYGKVDRARSGVTGDIINYRCDRAYVIFDFSVEEGDRRRFYRVRRDIFRRKNAQLTLSELDGEAEHCISDGVTATNARIREIVGLSFEDFKKCIALPQGEFAQFVKADRGERLKLISRLFDLEMYGDRLNAVLKRRFDEAKSAFDRKDGELSGYEEYTQEALDARRADLARLQGELRELEDAYQHSKGEFDALQADYERYLKWQKWQQARAALSAREEEMRAKKEDSSRLPAAEQACALDVQMRSWRRQAEENEAGAAKLRAQRAVDDEKLAALRREAEEADAENVLLSLREKRAALQHAQADAEILSKARGQRDRAAEAYRKAAARKGEAEKARQAHADFAASLQEKLKQTEAAADLSKFLRGGLDSALLGAEYADAEGYFREKLEQLRRDFSGGELYARVEEALCERLEHYGTLRGQAKSTDIERLLQEFRSAQKERDALTKRLHDAELGRTQAEGKLRAAEEDLARATQDGQAANESADGALARLKAVLGEGFNEDVRAYGEALRRKEEAVAAEKKKREDKMRALEESIRAAELSITRAEERGASLRQRLKESEEDLRARLNEGNFAALADAEALRARRPDAKALAAEIERYTEEVARVEAGIRAIEGEGKIVPVDEALFAEKRSEFQRLTERRESTGKASAVFESAVSQFADKLARRRALEKERAALQRTFSNVEKLRDLLRGNRFVEFVAGEYLADISDSATELLLKLTNGRYYILYDQGFFVGDNFNGGERRSVNTLSGGETFLVSLSLALSLSAAIYAKSLRPIEFFFLDEGFGTLDEKLIDTVMDSLEKLKNKHFAIGLISHVEELKHRIDNKIVVTAASESVGSTIKISC